MTVMGRPSWQAWIDDYAQSHQHPVNRVFHTVGIPMLLLSLAITPLALVIPGFWRAPLALFVVGWMFQFAGHAFEKKPPEFLRDWRFLLVGARWWFAKMQGRA